MKQRKNALDRAKDLLGISGRATAEDTKKRYRELVKIWHPDINPDEGASERMQEINRAYALLMKEEFGILDPWNEYNRRWLQQFGNDPIWSSVVSVDEAPAERQQQPKKLPKGKR